MLIDLITVAAFVTIVVGVFIVRSLVLSWRGPLEQQLAVDAGGALEPDAPVFGDLTLPLAEQLPSLLAGDDALQHDLRQAGYYKPSARSEFLAIRNVLALGALLFTGLTAVMIGPDRPDLTAPILIWGFAAAALFYVLPWLYLKQRARRRVGLIQRALPDAFDMLTMCMTGGLSIQESLGRVSREIYYAHSDLAVELEIVRQQTEMLSLGDAFAQFAERIDCPEVVSLASLVRQTERLGSNAVNAVRDFADGIRVRQRQTADERASKAGIKMLFPLVLCLAPSTLIILWGPALLELRNFFRTFDLNN